MNARAVRRSLYTPQRWRVSASTLLIALLLAASAGCGTVGESAELGRGAAPKGGSGERAREAVPLPMPPAPRLITVRMAPEPSQQLA